MTKRLSLIPVNESTIQFPAWVAGPTPCKTRTFSVVVPGIKPYLPHGAKKIVRAFPNRPMVKLPRIGAPGFYMGWQSKETLVQLRTGVIK